MPFTVPPTRGADAAPQAAAVPPAAAAQANGGAANGSATNGSGNGGSLREQLERCLEAVSVKTKELALAQQRLADAEAALHRDAPADAAAAEGQPPVL